MLSRRLSATALALGAATASAQKPTEGYITADDSIRLFYRTAGHGDLDAVRRHFKIDRVVLVAHSYGPLLAATYAIAHPDHVRGMIFFGPVPPRRGDFFQRFGKLIRSDLCASDPAGIRYGLTKTNRIVNASYGDWDLRSALPALHMPVLVVHGEEDAIPVDLVNEWTMIPNARLFRVPGAAHFAYAERPDAVWPEVDRFFAELRSH